MLDWLKKIGDNVGEMVTSASNNIGKVFLLLGLTAVVFLAAYFAEKVLCSRNGIDRKSEKFKINKMTIVAMMAILAWLLDYLSPFYLIPHMYKVSAEELPCIIGAFAMGPMTGVIIEFVKVILNLLSNGTSTAFVGEFANFIMGCCFVIPASIIYFRNKKKKSAAKGLIIGIVVNLTVAVLLNRFLLLPMYAGIFCGGNIDAIIAMGTDSIHQIDGMFTFLAWAVAPCNLIKTVGASVITLLIYKPISHLIKNDNYKKMKKPEKSDNEGNTDDQAGDSTN